MPFDPRVHAGVGVLVSNPLSRMLMIRRKGAHGAGQWSVPGGWIDYGEEPEHAALRELKEEVGLVGHHPQLVDVVSTTFAEPVDTCITLFYKVQYSYFTMFPVVQEPDKISEIQWLPRSEIDKLDLFPPFQEVLNRHAWVVTA